MCSVAERRLGARPMPSPTSGATRTSSPPGAASARSGRPWTRLSPMAARSTGGRWRAEAPAPRWPAAKWARRGDVYFFNETLRTLFLKLK